MKKNVSAIGPVPWCRIRSPLDGTVSNGQITVKTGALEPGISDRWFRTLYADYLKACSEQQEESWHPGSSGGNRQQAIPGEVEELWKRMLGASEPAPYGFAASEAFRRFEFSLRPSDGSSLSATQWTRPSKAFQEASFSGSSLAVSGCRSPLADGCLTASLVWFLRRNASDDRDRR